MAFSEIIGHKEVIRALKASLVEARTGHAYLFLGPVGVGKKSLAREFAAGLLCSSVTGECGEECQSCHRFYQGSHPDFITVIPSGNSIKIEQLRDLQRNSYLSPLLGKRKVFFFPEAERLTEAAANSFLKILEEPPPGVVFLFTAVRAENILPTIRSRCQVYNLFPVSQKEIVFWLKSKGYSENEATSRALECQGLPGAALTIKESSTNRNSPKFSEVLSWDLLSLLKFANELEKRERREVLSLLQEWEVQLRINILQIVDSLSRSQEQIPELIFLAEKLTRVIEMIEANVNLRLALDELFLGIRTKLYTLANERA